MEYNQELKHPNHLPVLCWGHKRLPKQEGVAIYTLSPNRTRPSLHFYSKGSIYNVIRRTRHQFLYVVPPFLVGYLVMDWANKKNEHLNSKEGRVETEEG
uniref:Cytochrome b-c1 complex subunit 8 n=1 Tax=Capnodium sp. TTI-000886 TaxID=3078996 RepID=A0AA96S1N9_9PEZI|nr:CapN [Capnodium sp. TTI-000886]